MADESKSRSKSVAERLAWENSEEGRRELDVRRKARKSKKELEHHRRQEKEYIDEIERLHDLLKIAADLREDTERWSPITVPKREKGVIKEGTAVLLYSDIHPEEVVTPDKVSDLNEFNPDIARHRIEQLIIGTRWMLDAVRSHGKGDTGYKIRDFVLALLGDLISNTYHADLAESVAMGPADAVNLVFDLLQMVIDALLEDKQIERIIIPCCMGNHDRMTQRIRHQTKAETSLATIIYRFLQRLYRNEKRVQFDIARGNMTYTNVYDHMIRFTHGDDIKYYGGVGGLTIPMRKAIDSWNESIDADLTCCGHWHTIHDHRDFVVNGSVIGYTAYAQAIKARYEPAAQAFFILDPERGKRFFSPVKLQQNCERWI